MQTLSKMEAVQQRLVIAKMQAKAEAKADLTAQDEFDDFEACGERSCAALNSSAPRDSVGVHAINEH